MWHLRHTVVFRDLGPGSARRRLPATGRHLDSVEIVSVSRHGGDDCLAFSCGRPLPMWTEPPRRLGTAPLSDRATRAIATTEPRSEGPRRLSRMRRGWLVRRMLLAADLLALTRPSRSSRYSFAEQLVDDVGIGVETVIFLACCLSGSWRRSSTASTTETRSARPLDSGRGRQRLPPRSPSASGSSTRPRGSSAFASPDQAKLATFWFLALVGRRGGAIGCARTLARRQPAYVQNTLIVGAGDVGQLVGRKLLQHPEYGINLVGFVDAEPEGEAPRPRRSARSRRAGRHRRDRPSVNDVDRVIVAFSRDRHEEMLELVRAIRKHDVQVDIVPRLFEAVGANVDIHTVEGLPLVGLPPSRISRSSRLLKRSLDVVGASRPARARWRR